MSYKKLLIAKNTVKSCNPYSTIFLQSHIYSYSGRKWSKKPCSGNILYRHLWNEFKLDLKCNDKNRDHILVHSVRGILNGCMNNTIKRLQNHQGAASEADMLSMSASPGLIVGLLVIFCTYKCNYFYCGSLR